jgi:hypothetical protein
VTWSADNELVARFEQRLAEQHGQYGPARGTIGISAGGRPLYCGPESTLSLAKRHYATLEPRERPGSFAQAMTRLRFALGER